MAVSVAPTHTDHVDHAIAVVRAASALLVAVALFVVGIEVSLANLWLLPVGWLLASIAAVIVMQPLLKAASLDDEPNW